VFLLGDNNACAGSCSNYCEDDACIEGLCGRTGSSGSLGGSSGGSVNLYSGVGKGDVTKLGGSIVACIGVNIVTGLAVQFHIIQHEMEANLHVAGDSFLVSLDLEFYSITLIGLGGSVAFKTEGSSFFVRIGLGVIISSSAEQVDAVLVTGTCNLVGVVQEEFERIGVPCGGSGSCLGVIIVGRIYDVCIAVNGVLTVPEKVSGERSGSVSPLLGFGKALDCKTSKKIAKFVSICDAFSIPVITQVDAEEFECLSGATAVLSAYTEATTIKISVVTGKATGPVYMALAGSAGRMDAVLAMTCAVISPVKPEAAAYIALGDNLTGTVAEQDAQISQYIATELGAENAAKAGYIDDIADDTTLRTKLINYLDILSSKRESSLPKKHSTI